MASVTTTLNEKAAAGTNRDGLNFISSTTTHLQKETAYALYYNCPTPRNRA